jgi:hypothetical protein
MTYGERAYAFDILDFEQAPRSDCEALNRLASDQRETVAQHCPACGGEGGRCLVEMMEELVAAETVPGKGNDRLM